MSLTSLGLASDGLLDGGSSPTLHLATGGFIRLGGDVQPPTGGGGSSGGGFNRGTRRKITPRHIDALIQHEENTTQAKRREERLRAEHFEHLQRLQTAKLKLKVATKRQIETFEAIDVDLLEQLVADAFIDLPSTRRKVDLVQQDIERLNLPVVAPVTIHNDLNLRLLLLLGI